MTPRTPRPQLTAAGQALIAALIAVGLLLALQVVGRLA